MLLLPLMMMARELRGTTMAEGSVANNDHHATMVTEPIIVR